MKEHRPIRFTSTDISAMLLMLLYASSATVTPICFLAISRDFGLSLTEGGGIEGVRSTLVFLTLFLSGFFAVKLGKVRSLGFACALAGFGFLGFALAPSYEVILLSVVAIGIGSGVLEGLINPLVQDLHPTDSGRYLNIVNAFWSVGVFTTTLLGGDALTRGLPWRYIMGALALLSIPCTAVVLASRKHEAFSPTPTAEVLRHYLRCLRSRRFWVFCLMMFLAGGSEGAFTFWSASYIQVNFGANARMGGIGTACFAAGMMLMRFGGGVFIKQNHLRRFILLSALGGIVIGLVAPFVDSPFWFFPTLFAAGLSLACFWPSIQSYSVGRLGLDETSVFILLSCAGIPGFGLTSLAMGLIGDAVGLRFSFFLVPAMLTLLAGVVLLERAVAPRQGAPAGTEA